MSASHSPKIIFSANTGWYLWNFRRNLMQALERASYTVIAVSPRDEYAERLAREFTWYEVRHLNRSGLNPIADLMLMVEYVNLFRNIKPDLVMNLTIKPGIYGGIACRILGLPTIATVTGLGTAFLEKTLLQKIVIRLYKYAFASIRAVMFQNEESRDLFLHERIIDPAKAVMVPGSGVDLEKFIALPLPSTGTNVQFLFIGRMLRDKGVELFAQAAGILKKQFPDAQFVLAGPVDDNNPSSVHLDEIDSWQRSGTIVYRGLVNDVVGEMGRADVVVLPSWYPEGIPKSLLEAMAMARPIITADIPGCRAVVQGSKNGILIAPKRLDALVDAMRSMIMLPAEQRTQMGLQGRMIAEQQFDQEIVFEINKKIIREVLK